MRIAFAMLCTLLPATANAVGGDDNTPPTPTETTERCTEGRVWDEASNSCAVPKDARFNDDTLIRAAREFAYSGQFDHALGVLRAVSDQRDDRVLTYMGFVHRKIGNPSLALSYYAAAIAKNPDNLLARSYRGQAYVDSGDLVLARTELSEIRRRGGRATWPELALRNAIASGRGYSY